MMRNSWPGQEGAPAVRCYKSIFQTTNTPKSLVPAFVRLSHGAANLRASAFVYRRLDSCPLGMNRILRILYYRTLRKEL
jgi:hypothetical protein